MKLLEFVEIFSFIWRVLKGKLKKSWLFQYDITDVIQIHEVEKKVGQKGSTAQQKNIKHQTPIFLTKIILLFCLANLKLPPIQF